MNDKSVFKKHIKPVFSRFSLHKFQLNIVHRYKYSLSVDFTRWIIFSVGGYSSMKVVLINYHHLLLIFYKILSFLQKQFPISLSIRTIMVPSNLRISKIITSKF